MTAIIYTLITSVATVAGGLLPFHSRFRKIEMRYLIAFASGLMISIVFFEMLPESMPGSAMALALGFFVVYLLEKLVMIHACGEEECDEHVVGWTSLIGIGIESLIDGAAIVAAYALAPALGLVVAVAVFAHELPRGFTTTVIMRNAGFGRRGVALALAVDAGFAPIGALLAGFITRPDILPNLVAFAAGTFIYIGASDLLPEAHRRFNVKVVGMVILGAILVPLVEQILRV